MRETVALGHGLYGGVDLASSDKGSTSSEFELLMAASFTLSVAVLIVEDEPLVRTIAVDMLEEAGLAPVEAADARATIEILERRADIKIVFTDVDMPGDMNGVALAGYVRNRWPPIGLIVTSGMPPYLATLPSGSLSFPKPYRFTEVIAGIQALAASVRR